MTAPNILKDGYQSLIEFAENASVKFYEKTVTPPGLAAGGAIDTTTMRNTRWRTKATKKLIEAKDASINVAYDPACYDDIIAMLGVNQQITITFPDASTLVFWGSVDEFDPKELKEGEQPTADVKIICTNENDAGAETAPDYVAPTP